MAKRTGISKRTRFEIFKRDGFTCQYCGSKPPKVPLEIDHITPVSKEGTNDDYNLITSCFDCNRGKSNKELSISPITISERAEKMKLAQAQYKEIKKLIDKEKAIINEQIEEVESIFSSSYPKFVFNDRFKVSVKTFLGKLDTSQVCEAMEIACTRCIYPEKTLAYFCGVCWNKIKES